MHMIDLCWCPTAQINKIVPSVTYHPHFKSQDDDQLQADKLAVCQLTGQAQMLLISISFLYT